MKTLKSMPSHLMPSVSVTTLETGPFQCYLLRNSPQRVQCSNLSDFLFEKFSLLEKVEIFGKFY